MSSGFATVRCLRCGSYTEGGQFCASCIAQQRAEEEARAERVAKTLADRPAASGSSASGAAGMLCPSCGRFASATATFCGYCRFQFRAHREAGDLAYAGFWIRFVAWLVDSIIVVFVAGIPALTIGVMTQSVPLGYLIYLVVYVAYYAWGNGTGGTLGKQICGIRVVSLQNGGDIGLGAGIGRWFVWWLGSIPFYLGWLWMIWDERKQGWHDKVAGSAVVKARS